MKQYLLVLCLLFIISYANIDIVLDCNGDVSFDFQNWDLKFSISQLKKTYNAIHDTLFERLQCKCPGITKEEFLRRYAIATWDFHYHKLTSYPNDNSSTCAEQFPEWDNNYNLYDFSDFTIQAANCNYDNWKKDIPCLLKFPVSYLDLEMQLAVAKCPNSYLPYISVTCAGEGCKTIGMPCNENSDCSANQECTTIPLYLNSSSIKRNTEENQNEMKVIGNKMSAFVSAALTGSNNPITYVSNLASKLVDLVNPSNSKKRELSQSGFESDNALFFQGFSDAMIYDENDTSPGCVPGSKFLTNSLSFLRSNLFNKNTPYGFENSPNLKFKVCLFNVSDPEKTQFGIESNFTTNTTNPEILSLSTIKEWNGKLSDGSDVTNSNRMQGKSSKTIFEPVPTITPGATTLFHHSCNNQFSLLPRGSAGLVANMLYFATQPLYTNTTRQVYNPNNGTYEYVTEVELSPTAYSSIFAPILSQSTFKLPFLNEFSNFWFPENFNIQTCRAAARGKVLSVEEYKRRYGFSIAYALYFTTRMNAKSLQSVQMSDFLFDFQSNIFAPPSTCTYENYLNTKSCTVSFTGLQSLLGVDITINIKATECADYVLPSIYGECVGNDCKILTTPIKCSTQSDCSTYPGTKCINIEDQYTEQSDFIQGFFTHNITSDASTCTGKSKISADLKKFLGILSGSTVNSLSFCILNGSSWFTDSPNVNFTEWAESQYIVSGDTFTIRDLKSWTPTTVENQQAVVDVKLEIPQSNQTSDLDYKILMIIAKTLGIDPKYLKVTVSINGNDVSATIVINKVAPDGSVLQSDPNNVASSVNQELSNPNSGASTTLSNDLGAVIKSTTSSSSQSIISFIAVFVALCLVLLF